MTKKNEITITLGNGETLIGHELNQEEYLNHDSQSISVDFGYFPDVSGTKVVPSDKYKSFGSDIVEEVDKVLGRK